VSNVGYADKITLCYYFCRRLAKGGAGAIYFYDVTNVTGHEFMRVEVNTTTIENFDDRFEIISKAACEICVLKGTDFNEQLSKVIDQ
jgi:hypothetical protein